MGRKGEGQGDGQSGKQLRNGLFEQIGRDIGKRGWEGHIRGRRLESKHP